MEAARNSALTPLRVRRDTAYGIGSTRSRATAPKRAGTTTRTELLSRSFLSLSGRGEPNDPGQFLRRNRKANNNEADDLQ
jgi:hypothetical protein